MDHPILRPTWETTLPTAWQDQLVPAVQIPWLPQTAMPHGNALLPRFVAWYEQLQALPRRLRRALQRKLALPLAGVALLLALGQGLSQATTLVVGRSFGVDGAHGVGAGQRRQRRTLVQFDG